jgi:tetratricopeptide (TPR) repeat protein
MKLSPRYKMSLSAISLVALPVLVAFAPMSQVVLAQESGASLSVVAQADRKAEADRLFNQGSQQFQISRFEAALQSWEQALTIYRAIKDRQGEGAALGSLGSAYYSRGKYEKAIEFYLQSLAIAREIKDRRGEGQSLGNLGIAYYSLGKYDKAIGNGL